MAYYICLCNVFIYLDIKSSIKVFFYPSVNPDFYFISSFLFPYHSNTISNHQSNILLIISAIFHPHLTHFHTYFPKISPIFYPYFTHISNIFLPYSTPISTIFHPYSSHISSIFHQNFTPFL